MGDHVYNCVGMYAWRRVYICIDICVHPFWLASIAALFYCTVAAGAAHAISFGRYRRTTSKKRLRSFASLLSKISHWTVQFDLCSQRVALKKRIGIEEEAVQLFES